jgi:hypothetical protein
MTIDKNSGSSFPSASEYILNNFEPIDRIAMLVLNRDLGEILQRITSALKASSPEFQAWLRYKKRDRVRHLYRDEPAARTCLKPNEERH